MNKIQISNSKHLLLGPDYWYLPGGWSLELEIFKMAYGLLMTPTPSSNLEVAV